MINKILVKLGLGDGSLNAETDTRRKFIRYNNLRADVEVAGLAYSLKDWSMGGFSFNTLPDARLMAGDKVRFALHFRFPHDTIRIEQEARILRTGRDGVAVRFDQVSTDARRDFDRVIDGIHAQDFLQSQTAANADDLAAGRAMGRVFHG